MPRQLSLPLAISFLALILTVCGLTLVFQPTDNTRSLERIHTVIEQDYPSVLHISPAQFSKLKLGEVVVFDVREPEEFDVSHLEGAIQVMPDIDPGDFIEDYGDLFNGKHVIFYCSVGRRSSELASKLAGAPAENGAIASFNLTGGVFDWVNQGRLLSDLKQQKTTKVHPYNDYWGKLVNDNSKLSYTVD